jgi:hypothetical protein
MITPMADHITPPGTVAESPLTPPPSDRKISCSVSSILNDLRSCEKGCGVKPWAVYLLSPDDYEGVLRALDSKSYLKSYVEDKIRWANLYLLAYCWLLTAGAQVMIMSPSVHA